MTERVRSSGRTGRGKLGGRLPDTAPPARPRVSHRLLGGKGLSLRAPGPQSPPRRGSLPHCDPDTQRPAAGGPATLSGARPFFTQSSKHSCTSGVSAAGGPPPQGKQGWVGSRGLRAHSTAPGDRAWWPLDPVSCLLQAIRSPRAAHPPLWGRRETRDLQSTPFRASQYTFAS